MNERPKDFDRPSRHGALLGEMLARVAAAGLARNPELPAPCLTCAFRQGTFPNQTAATLKNVVNCIFGVDDAGDFFCHHGMKDGEAQKVCAGYVAVLAMPYRFIHKNFEEMLRLYDLIDESTPDLLRVDFDAWLATADPEGKLDAYQLARAYAARDKCTSPKKI